MNTKREVEMDGRHTLEVEPKTTNDVLIHVPVEEQATCISKQRKKRINKKIKIK